MDNLEFEDLFPSKKIHQIKHKSLNGKNLIKAGSFKLEPSQENSSQAESEEKPSIQLKKRENMVETIVVTCSCGRETHIVLDYNDATVREEPAEQKNS